MSARANPVPVDRQRWSARATRPGGGRRELGPRAQKTLERILEAGVVVFQRYGFHAARVDDIVKEARVSHGTFYLYFSNKEELFRTLTTGVLEEAAEATQSLAPVTPTAHGHHELHAWISRFSDVYVSSQAVIQAWTEAEITTSEFGRLGTDLLARLTELLGTQVERYLPDTHPGVASLALVAMVERSHYYLVSRELAIPRDVMVRTLTSVAFNGLFTRERRPPAARKEARARSGGDVAAEVAPPPVTLGFGRRARQRPQRDKSKRTRERLMQAGLECFREHGFHVTRVDDIVRKAETSHGTFYLYFENREGLLRAMAADCAAEMSAMVGRLSVVDSGPEGYTNLRAWLSDFIDIYARFGPVIRAWFEDQASDPALLALGNDMFADVAAQFIAQAERSGSHVDDPAAAAVAFIAMIERFTYFLTSRGFTPSSAQVLDGLTTLIHWGFLNGAPPPSD